MGNRLQVIRVAAGLVSASVVVLSALWYHPPEQTPSDLVGAADNLLPALVADEE
jgi:hypothetical protein